MLLPACFLSCPFSNSLSFSFKALSSDGDKVTKLVNVTTSRDVIKTPQIHRKNARILPGSVFGNISPYPTEVKCMPTRHHGNYSNPDGAAEVAERLAIRVFH